MTIENAKITSTFLGIEDHGILTAYLLFEWGSSGCGFGGRAFDQYDSTTKVRRGGAYGTEWVRRVLDVLGVDQWEKLPGTYARIEHTGLGGGIVRIGHIIEDRWFDPDQIGGES